MDASAGEQALELRHVVLFQPIVLTTAGYNEHDGSVECQVMVRASVLDAITRQEYRT
jgi:hypothetical protein